MRTGPATPSRPDISASAFGCNREQSDVVRVAAASVMVTALSYSLVLPVLPQLAATVDPSSVAATTGSLMSSYTLAALIAAPLWGTAIDRYGAKGCLIAAVVGQALALAFLLPTPSSATLLGNRIAQGILGAGVVPASLVLVTSRPDTEERTAIAIARVTRASLIGGLLGPFVGGLLSRGNDLSLVVAGAALLAALTLVPVAGLRAPIAPAISGTPLQSTDAHAARVTLLLVLSAAVAFVMGASEVGVALRGRGVLGLSPSQLGLMFSGCGVVMIGVQTLLFRAGRLPRALSPAWIAPALWLAAASLVGLSVTRSTWAVSLIVAAIAAVAGGGQPLLTYWLARLRPTAAGVGFGWRTSIAGVGQAMGSLTAGYAFLGPDGLSFGVLAIAVVLVATGALSLTWTAAATPSPPTMTPSAHPPSARTPSRGGSHGS